jgi:hypothetical protein
MEMNGKSFRSAFGGKILGGSISLTALASVSGGVLFTLLFTNLVRYTAVKNALEQSAQKIARCIDPTDPACASYQPEAPTGERDWYRAADTVEALSTWVDRYNYTATLVEQQWRLTAPAFELHYVHAPQMTWTQYRVQRRTYSPELNRFEHRIRVIEADDTAPEYLRPVNTPNFPDLDTDYESSVRDRGIDLWHWIQLAPQSGSSKSSDAPIELDGAQTTVLPPIAVHFSPAEDVDRFKLVSFVTPYFPVPELGDGGPLPPCEPGRSCDVSAAAGGSSGSAANDFSQVAFVAVKTFATISALQAGQNPKIRWAGAPAGMGSSYAPNGWGLQIETLSPEAYRNLAAARRNAEIAGLPQPVDSDPSASECLGGRDGTSGADVVHGSGKSKSLSRNYDLRLRGPLEKDPKTGLPVTSGRDANCPNNDIQHSGLRVSRGGAYRFRGFMMVKGGDVNISVTFKHYFDSYKKVGGEVSHCRREQPLTQKDAADCPVCDPSAANESGRMCTLRIEPLLDNNRTQTADPTVFAAAPVDVCRDQISGVFCDDTLPQPSSACSAFLAAHPERQLIWSEPVTTAEYAVARLPAQCAVPGEQQQTSCGRGDADVVYRRDGRYGAVNDCPAAASILQGLSAATAKINSLQPPSAPQFPPAGEDILHWSDPQEYNPPNWELSTRSVDSSGQPVSDAESVRAVELSRENSVPVFRHTGSGWAPSLDLFGLSPEQAEDLRGSGKLSLRLVGETPRPLTAVYPFHSHPEYEIPSFLPTPEDLRSCSGEAAPLAERLRVYASSEVPQAADPSVAFDWQAEYQDTVKVGQAAAGCAEAAQASVSIPPCSRIARATSTRISCGSDEYLGRYSNTEFPGGPKSCTADASRCYSQPAPVAVHEQAPHIVTDAARAEEIGYSEIEHMLPGSGRNCSDPGCSTIAIDVSDPVRSKISLLYHMPLNFPLSAILGRDSVDIQETKEEVRETAAVGRFRGSAPEAE